MLIAIGVDTLGQVERHVRFEEHRNSQPNAISRDSPLDSLQNKANRAVAILGRTTAEDTLFGVD